MDIKKKKILIICSLFLIVALVGSVFFIHYIISNTVDDFNFDVIAEKLEKNEIFTDTRFIIKSQKDYSNKIMQQIVSVNPNVEYALEKTSKCTYVITPQEKLNDAAIYNVNINTKDNMPALSWAFQTKTEFKVTSVSPFDSQTYVKTNSGIEVSFSKQIENIEEYFEIVPQVEGTFKYLGKKAIFVPNELLAEDTVYKVKLNSGLKSYFNDELKEDYIFEFRTESTSPYIYLLNGYQETIKPTEIPKIGISADDKYNDATFNLKVYKLNSVEEYITYLETHYKNVENTIGKVYDYNFNMSNHFMVCEHTTKLQKENNSSWQDYLILPERLAIGWYIVDITNSLNNIHFQKALQVNDISIYVYSLNGEVKIWSNDSVTGGALAGGTVQLGDLASISNKDGVAPFNISTTDKQKIIVTSRDGKKFGEYVNVLGIQESSLVDDYYMYLYTDRKKYMPTDTINYWGVVIPRKQNISIPNEVEIEIASNIHQTVKVNENGAFYGSIDIVSHEHCEWATISLKIGEKEKYIADISISDYNKPVYKLSSEFDRSYYKKGDKINLNVYGKFYDGTSAENVKVKVLSGTNEYNTVTLNSNGEAKLKLTPNLSNQSGEMQYIYATLGISGIDEETSYTFNSVPYFPTDYYISTEWDAQNKKLILATNKVNYNEVNNKNFTYDKVYTGESFVQNIHADVIESKNVKRYTGETEYNYYTGTYTPKYTYDKVENVVNSYDLTIPKGENLIMDIPEMGQDPNATYRVNLTYTYPDNFSGTKEVYIWEYYNYTENAYYFSPDKWDLTENETARISLDGNKNKNGRMLYIVSTDRINKIGVTNNDTLDVKMDKNLIPDCMVYGAFFDGKKIYEINPVHLYFEPKERELLIDIKTDKESYHPGDNVKVAAKVTDVDGNPIQCNLLLSVVDEAALFNTYDQDILDIIYTSRAHYPLTFVSDIEELYGGEGGGGGEDEVRDTFTDVLAFESLYTDENGEAKMSFDVSDDLTSWRITGIAVSEDVKAGKTKKNITTSIPFFINQVINKKYTTKDDIVFSVRVAGNNVSSINSNILYEATLLDFTDKIIKQETKQEKTNETAMFNFGKVPSGKYTIKISAINGENKDAILKEIEVIDSLHEISIIKEIKIGEIEDVNAIKYPVRLMIFDKENGYYYKALQKILKESYGGSNEQVLSRNYAYKKLNEFYGKELYNKEFNTVLQESSGGAKKLTGGENDALFTAQVVANANEYINLVSAKNYFLQLLQNGKTLPSDLTAAYMGLAALKQPVLTDIKYLLENDTGLELLDKINLINALAYIGDYDSAIYYYDKVINLKMVSDEKGKYIKPEEEILYYQATSRILPMLALTKHDDFNMVLKYVLENDTKEYIPVMDLITYLNEYNPTTECKSEIKYELLGEGTKLKFSEEKVKFLELDKAEFDTLKIKSTKGEINAIIEYIGDISEVTKVNEDIKITKSISKGEIGEYSTVTINIKFPNGTPEYYVLDDIIPVSSRYVSSIYPEYNSSWHFLNREGQKVKFYVDSRKSNDITINYKIRNIFSGEFYIEPVVLTNSAGKVFYSVNNLLTFNVK